MLIVGLDGEMSGANIADGAVLIQAGAAALTDTGELTMFTSMLATPPPRADTWWNERAQQVHGFTIADVDSAPPAAEVDDALYDWLIGIGATPGRREVITVGFNVVAFDHPFFRAALPKAMSLVSRRGIDLNAACMLLDGWNPNRTQAPNDWLSWKRQARHGAEKHIRAAGITVDAHDAGYDAAEALFAFRWLQTHTHSAFTPPRQPPVGLPKPLRDKFSAQYSGSQLDALSDAFTAAGVNAGAWLQRPAGVALGNRTGFAALNDGDIAAVIAMLRPTGTDCP